MTATANLPSNSAKNELTSGRSTFGRFTLEEGVTEQIASGGSVVPSALYIIAKTIGRFRHCDRLS